MSGPSYTAPPPPPPPSDSFLGTGPDPGPSPPHSWALKSPDGRGHPTWYGGHRPPCLSTPHPDSGHWGRAGLVLTRRGACPLTG